MVIPTKKQILIDYFNQDKHAAKCWLYEPIKKFSGRTVYDVLYSEPEDNAAVEFLFSVLEVGLFAQLPPFRPLSKEEKRFLRDSGAKGVDDRTIDFCE